MSRETVSCEDNTPQPQSTLPNGVYTSRVLQRTSGVPHLTPARTPRPAPTITHMDTQTDTQTHGDGLRRARAGGERHTIHHMLTTQSCLPFWSAGSRRAGICLPCPPLPLSPSLAPHPAQGMRAQEQFGEWMNKRTNSHVLGRPHRQGRSKKILDQGDQRPFAEETKPWRLPGQTPLLARGSSGRQPGCPCWPEGSALGRRSLVFQRSSWKCYHPSPTRTLPAARAAGVIVPHIRGRE